MESRLTYEVLDAPMHLNEAPCRLRGLGYTGEKLHLRKVQNRGCRYSHAPDLLVSES